MLFHLYGGFLYTKFTVIQLVIIVINIILCLRFGVAQVLKYDTAVIPSGAHQISVACLMILEGFLSDIAPKTFFLHSAVTRMIIASSAFLINMRVPSMDTKRKMLMNVVFFVFYAYWYFGY